MSGRALERVTAAALAVALGAALTSVPVLRSAPAASDEAAARPVMPALGPGAAPTPADVELTMTDVAAVLAPAPSEVPAAVPVPGRPPVAQPPPVPLADSLQLRVDEALGSLGYPWQELGYDIRFVPYTGGLLGLADPGTRTITIFVKRTSSVQALRVVLAHEIGHALDDRTGSDEQRARYRELRGIPGDTPWFPCDRCEDYDSPAGDFAEVFAAWLVGPTDFRSRVAPLPTPEQLGRIAPLFAPLSPRAQAAPDQPVRPRPSPSRSPGLLGIGSGG